MSEVKWVDCGYGVKSCTIGVFTLTVQPRDGKWAMDLSGIKAAARWETEAEALAAAPRIARKWICSAYRACEDID